MDPRDRIVEYALWRLHRESAEVDLSREVRRALERGAVGPSLEDLPAEGAPPFEAPRRSPRAPYVWAAAAALLVAALGTLWSARDREPLSELSGPVARLTDGHWRTSNERSLAAGELAWTGPGLPVEVELAPGGALTVFPGTLFRLETREHENPDRGTRVLLEWGRLEARAPADASGGALFVEAGEAHVELAAGAVVAARLDWDGPAPAAGALHAIEAARARLAGGALGSLALEVVEGEAAVVAAGGPSALGAGEELRIALETRRPRKLDTTERLALLEDLRKLATSEDYWPGPESPIERLVARVEAEPAHAIELVEEVARRLDDAKLTRGARENLIDLLTGIRGELAAELARETFLAHPDWFRVENLVALAERGVTPFHEEVRAIVQHHDPAASERWVLPEDRRDPRLPAIYLALRRDDLGKVILEEALEDPTRFKANDGFHALAAAAALTRLGDRTAWSLCKVALAREARSLASSGKDVDRERAVLLVLAWEFIQRERVTPGPWRVADLTGRVQSYAMERAPGYPDAAALETLLEQLEQG